MARTKVASATHTLKEMAESGITGWDFENGKSLTFEVRKLFPNWDNLSLVARTGACRGFFEKVRDTYAGSKGSADVAYEKAAGAIEFLEAGEWTKTDREAGPRLSDLFEAINRHRELAGKARLSNDELKAKYAGEDNVAERERVRANEKIQAILADIALEKAQKRRDEKHAAAESAADADI